MACAKEDLRAKLPVIAPLIFTFFKALKLHFIKAFFKAFKKTLKWKLDPLKFIKSLKLPLFSSDYLN